MFPKQENPDQDSLSLSSRDCLEAAPCFPERWLERLGTAEPSTEIKATSSRQPPRRRYWQWCSLHIPSPPDRLRKQSGCGLRKETLPVQLCRGQQQFRYGCINPYSTALLLAFCCRGTIDNTFLKFFPPIIPMNNTLGVWSNTPPTTLINLCVPLPRYTRSPYARQSSPWHDTPLLAPVTCRPSLRNPAVGILAGPSPPRETCSGVRTGDFANSGLESFHNQRARGVAKAKVHTSLWSSAFETTAQGRSTAKESCTEEKSCLLR